MITLNYKTITLNYLCETLYFSIHITYYKVIGLISLPIKRYITQEGQLEWYSLNYPLPITQELNKTP